MQAGFKTGSEIRTYIFSAKFAPVWAHQCTDIGASFLQCNLLSSLGRFHEAQTLGARLFNSSLISYTSKKHLKRLA